MLGKIHLRPYETRSFVNVNIIVTFHRLPLFGILGSTFVVSFERNVNGKLCKQS